MSAKLYQKCEMCATSGVRAGPLGGPRKVHCLLCDGLGFVAVGLTMGQVEALQDDRDRLLSVLADIASVRLPIGSLMGSAAGVIQHAVEIVHGRQGEVEEARRRLRIPTPERGEDPIRFLCRYCAWAFEAAVAPEKTPRHGIGLVRPDCPGSQLAPVVAATQFASSASAAEGWKEFSGVPIVSAAFTMPPGLRSQVHHSPPPDENP